EVRGCTEYAQLLMSGAPNLPKDEARALRLFADSCSKGSFNGCFGVARALLRGGRGAAEAVPYLRYACGYKLPEACDELARLLDSGEIGTNLVEAASLSQYSCGQGIAAGCLRLSGYYE